MTQDFAQPVPTVRGTFPRTVAEPELAADTRWHVGEVLSRYGHIVDNAEWSYLPWVFTADASLNAQGLSIRGLIEIERYLQPLDRWTSHHTLNTATRYVGNDVSAWSRFLIVEATGTTISGDYVDLLTRTSDGWRIRSRRVSLRSRPELAPDGQPWCGETFATWTTG